MNALLHYDGDYARITSFDPELPGEQHEIVTCRIWPGKYVRIDDGKTYPQLIGKPHRQSGACHGSPTVVAAAREEDIGPALAKAIDARFFKTREAYEKAKAAL